MVSAHRNPVVGAELASRAELLLSEEVGASVLDRKQGLENGQTQAQGPGSGSGLGQGPGLGVGSGGGGGGGGGGGQGQGQGRGQGQRQGQGQGRVDQGGGQLVDKSAIDLALARAGATFS